MYAHIVTLFDDLVGASFKFFWSPMHVPPLQNSNGNRLNSGGVTWEWENFEISDRNCRLSRKQYEIGPWLLWNFNRR